MRWYARHMSGQADTIEPFLANPLWLAPMAGVTNRAFRTLCLEHGCGLTCTEMVSAAGLAYGNAATWELTEPADAEGKVAVQLFGSDPALMAREAVAVARRLGERLALVDVNMGCPVRKVVGKGEGAALMREPLRAAEIVSAIVSALDEAGPGGAVASLGGRAVPVTAKFRSGWESGEGSAVDFARRLEEAGASMLAVHGRSAAQMYSGRADWDVIADVAAAVCLPVAGSGDVFSHGAACSMLEETGADAVLVARGARGNPWVFSGADPTPGMRADAMRRYLDLYCQAFGEGHLAPLRSQLSFFVRGTCGASGLRRRLAQATVHADFETVCDAVGEGSS